MGKLLMLGDEAIAQAGLDAGMSGMYAYPGTPSTEIMEYVQKSKQAKENGVHAKWSANEKTSMEAALGMSYAGKRAMCAMKHVGLNVAADAFINSAITGVNGGLIVVSADDPSMHSSQNEQDNRFYGKFAQIPILEPANQQEAYNMVHYGFEISEKFKVPVLMRITTRLAHSRSGVETITPKAQNELVLPRDPMQFILLPSVARKNYKTLLSNFDNFISASEESQFNEFIDASDKSLGIITCGIAYNYLVENYEDQKVPYPVLRIGQYPLPKAKIKHIMETCDEVLVVEDGYPMVEEMLKGYLGKEKVRGRLDGSLPRDGELNPNLVLAAIHKETFTLDPIPSTVANRLPAMCKGCGHIDAYVALNEALLEHGKGRVFADIGCYTLGAYEPYQAISTCVDMGASITMAKGAADAGLVPSVAVIGDSTFTHSGITGLIDAVIGNSPITVVISDNYTTGMTGGQDSAALGRIEQICEGVGVDPAHIRVFHPTPANHDQMVELLKEELAYPGVSVVIPRRQCIQTMKNKELVTKVKELGLNKK
ncbi:MAG: indolepyruvate ferredoxin oxidoreductase [Bacteroidales bacterium]|nr:indolepyruvate ferredoxin oxidoreductase [Bacteroidales bacterium]